MPRRGAGLPLQETCRAGEPLVHSILLPTATRCEQQGQVEANLAVMIMASSVVVPLTPLNLGRPEGAVKGVVAH